ncbi:hypothetical protein [Flavobacterium sp. N1994]|uniref:hypothetical protein n=1 Tax=Flavobacterium sp. N1994 TaxID=2986827 RepID=UPI002222E004|nr:hypothetical protein [Flavobacterium sp. N1994]
MKAFLSSFFILFISHFILAQNDMTISFNESIHLSNVSTKTQFIITGGTEKIQLKGNEINSYKFQKPGKYTIKIIDNSSKKKDCEEVHLPNEIKLNVSRIKMTFDTKHISFSEPIRKNKDTANTTVSIPVTITTYDQQPVVLNNKTVTSAGIGTTITAHLKNSNRVYYDGTHIIQYSLTGQVTENSWLMFDFIDANDTVQSVSLVTPIQD